MGRKSAPWPKTTPPQGGFFLAGPMVSLMGAEAEVTGVAGKVITFQVTAFDESGEIGCGTHQRVLVHAQRFLEKAYEKI